MHNKKPNELVKYLIDNKAQILNSLKRKYPSDYEDIMQQLLLSFSTVKYVPNNMTAFVNTCIKRRKILQSRKIKNISKVFVNIGDDQKSDYYNRVDNSFTPNFVDFKLLYKHIDNLPSKRKIVINNFLADKDFTDFNGNYNTGSAHYRHAFLELRRTLKDELGLSLSDFI